MALTRLILRPMTEEVVLSATMDKLKDKFGDRFKKDAGWSEI